MRDTYQKELMVEGINAISIIDLQNRCNEIAARIMTESEKLISVEKRFACYGSYRYGLWMNEYRFGKDFSEWIKRNTYKFGDDEADYTIQDFKKDIEETCFEYAYQFYN